MKKAIVLATALFMALIFTGQVYAQGVNSWFLQRRTTNNEVYWRLQFDLSGFSVVSSDTVKEVRIYDSSQNLVKTFQRVGGAGYNWSFGHEHMYSASYDNHDSMFWARDSMFTYDVDEENGLLIETEYYQWMITFDDFDLDEPSSPDGYDVYYLLVYIEGSNFPLTPAPFKWYGKTDLPIVDTIGTSCDNDGNLWLTWDPPLWAAWAAINSNQVERYGKPTHVSVAINLDLEGDANTDPIVESSYIWVGNFPMHMGLFLIPETILTQLINIDQDGNAYVNIITRTSDNNNRVIGDYTEVKLDGCKQKDKKK